VNGASASSGRRYESLLRWTRSRGKSGVLPRLVAVGTYVATLHIIYATWIAPLFAYIGFVYFEPSLSDWALATCLIAVFTVTLPPTLSRPNRLASWWLFLTLTVPVTLVPIYQRGDVPLRTWVFAALAGTTTSLFGHLDRLPRLRLPRVSLSERAFAALLLTFSAVVLVWTLVVLPLHFNLVWLTDVSAQRATFGKALAGTSGAYAYALSWQFAAVFPAMLTFGLDRSRPYLVALALIGQITLYGLTGYKQGLISLIFVPAIYFILRRPRWRATPAVWLAGGLTAVAWFAVVLDKLTGSIDFTSVFVRRAILLAGITTQQYLAFFSTNGPDFFSHSALAGIVRSHYDAPPPLLIARAYYHLSYSANANFLADGYANLGFAGVVVMACIVGGLLYLASSVTDVVTVAPAGAMLILPLTSLANSAGFATITTHGLGLAVLLVILYPRAERLARPTTDLRLRARRARQGVSRRLRRRPGKSQASTVDDSWRAGPDNWKAQASAAP
jgi:O-antigen polymerase